MKTEGVLLNTFLPTVTFEQVCGGGHRRAMARGQAEEQHATETDYIKLTFRFCRLAHSLAGVFSYQEEFTALSVGTGKVR